MLPLLSPTRLSAISARAPRFLAFAAENMVHSARRDSSRLDQDLKTIRRSSTVASDRQVDGQVRTTFGHRKPHVGIIGAGIAGLRCADILLQHGFEVTVLEGRQRLGGRLHQERLPNGRLVDMGPNWIHGSKDNPILDLVRATDTVTSNNDTDAQGKPLDGAVFDQSGALLPLEVGTALSTAMWNIVEEAFVESNDRCSDISASESLHDFFRRKLAQHVPETAPDHEARRAQILQMADFWGAFVGSSVTKQSLKYFWLEECIEGENLFCAGTYAKVLDTIAKPAVEGATIRYGTTVTRVGGRTGNSPDSSISAATACGQSFSFDEIVCTAPLGWLQRNLAAFQPPLDPRLCKAIDSISYGCLEKVYMSFPDAFWLQPDEKTGRVTRGFFQWLAPGVYAQPSNVGHWPHEAVDLASLPGPTAHPTLLFYIFGDQSQHITDTLAALPDDEKQGFLFAYFRPYYSRLPHYDAASSACQPTGCLATGWLHDDLAGHGSYSNFQVGLEAGDEDIRVMREGMPDRGLWLAGEHTAPFVALGTATGAYWSGESVGRRIAEAYGRKRAATETAADHLAGSNGQ